MKEETLAAALKKYFGYDQFRNGQKEVIASVLAGKDTLAVLPTGTGKSLCYQLPAYLVPGIVLIVSPLISLMEDQLLSLPSRSDMRGIAFNSTLSNAEKQFVLQHLTRYKFVFISPEMLLKKEVLQRLQQVEIALFVVDEAHCISQWGIDFRPEYRQLKQVKQFLGEPTTLALTATATAAVQNDITENLLTDPAKIVYSVNRENIALFVTETEDKLASLIEILAHFATAGIIYCSTRKKVEEVYQALQGEFSAGYYHGGLASDQRRLLQQQFTTGKLQLLVATNAFGMGINKADIRFVIHYDLPDSLENYLQEIGRAGRDQQPSYAYLLYQPGDEQIHHFFNQQLEQQRTDFEHSEQISTENELHVKWQAQATLMGKTALLEQIKANEVLKQQKLQKMLAYIQTSGCRREFILRYFAEKLVKRQMQCCDHDGAVLPRKQISTPKSPPVPESWQQILLKLFKEKD